MHEKGKRATGVDEENQISEAGNTGDRYGRIQRLPMRTWWRPLVGFRFDSDLYARSDQNEDEGGSEMLDTRAKEYFERGYGKILEAVGGIPMVSEK